jgi:hypothetical protein
VFFDEPELHLHPELSYRLIQTLQIIGERNQFFLSTHSPDVISASLDRSVIFLAPPSIDPSGVAENQAMPVSEADETNQALRLLGQSIGIVALGRRLVLIEGTQSSLDKQTYGSITRGAFPSLVLVPSGGKHVIESFALVYDTVLSRSIWGVEFFMLCDRDSSPPASLPQTTSAETSGRLRVLPRYHLENYFLDERVWARAFAVMEPATSWLCSPPLIRGEFRRLAEGIISYASALAVAAEFRLNVGNVDLMPDDCHGKSDMELVALLAAKTGYERTRVLSALDDVAIADAAAGYYRALSDSLTNDTDDWKALIPGKPLLGMFAAKANVPTSRAKTMYINAVEGSGLDPFRDILDIFAAFAAV